MLVVNGNVVNFIVKNVRKIGGGATNGNSKLRIPAINRNSLRNFYFFFDTKVFHWKSKRDIFANISEIRMFMSYITTAKHIISFLVRWYEVNASLVNWETIHSSFPSRSILPELTAAGFNICNPLFAAAFEIRTFVWLTYPWSKYQLQQQQKYYFDFISCVLWFTVWQQFILKILEASILSGVCKICNNSVCCRFSKLLQLGSIIWIALHDEILEYFRKYLHINFVCYWRKK